MLDAHAVKRKRRRRARYLLRTAAAVALIVCISVPLAFTVDASRAAVANFLIQNFDQFSRITYDVENNAKAPVGWTSEYYPQWLPEGYQFDQIYFEENMQAIWYINNSYRIQFIVSSDSPLAIDTENTNCYERMIGSYKSLLYVKDDKRSTSLAIFSPSETIYIQGNLTEDEIMKMAKNIHSIS